MPTNSNSQRGVAPLNKGYRGVGRYDDSLARAGDVVDPFVHASIFEEYHRRKSHGTKAAQLNDLTLFSRFLARIPTEIPIARDPHDLFSDAHAWLGMRASLLVGFRNWLLYGQPRDLKGKAKGYTHSSVKRRMSTIKQYCRLAYQSKVISAAEWALIFAVKADSHAEGVNIDDQRRKQGIQPRISNRKEEAVPLDTHEVFMLRHTSTSYPRFRERDYILSERDELLICLLGEHGLRVSEVVALNVKSVNVRTRTIAIKRQKTYDKDVLQLLPATKASAEKYLPLIAEDGPLFVGYAGERITRQGIYKRVRDLGKLLNIPNLSPHDLRHFFTKDAFLQGNPLNLIQQYGGWKSGHMPLRYAQEYGVTITGLQMSTE